MRENLVNMLFNISLAQAFHVFGVLQTALALSIDINPKARDAQECTTDYTTYASTAHAPLSSGKYQLGYQRPPKKCRTFVSDRIEKKIKDMKDVIKDPDLYRLFENSYPNTLDTTVKWTGKADGSEDELTFIITGDM